MPLPSCCPACSGKLAFVHRFTFGRLYRCQRCGTRTIAPTKKMLYDRDYYRSWFADSRQEIEKIKRINFRHLLTHELGGLEGKKLLDTGCATGFLLQEAGLLGAELYGVDVSEWAVGQAREKLPQARLFTGSLEEAISNAFLAPGSFDVLVGTDVIEHVFEVRSFLIQIHRLLRPGGRALLTTPDPEAFSCRILGPYWFQYKLEHVNFLTRKALALLSGEIGFEILRIRTHKKRLTPEYLCNVLQYQHSGLLSDFGRWGGRFCERAGMARKLLSFRTGEILVLLQKKERSAPAAYNLMTGRAAEMGQ